MTDVRLVTRPGAAEPYLAVVHGRHVYRRCNETLRQFQARIDTTAARLLETWSRKHECPD